MKILIIILLALLSDCSDSVKLEDLQVGDIVEMSCVLTKPGQDPIAQVVNCRCEVVERTASHVYFDNCQEE